MPTRSRARETVQITADLAVLTIRQGELRVLVVNRGKEPFKGMYALPGGFMRPGETLDDTALRELQEETAIEGGTLGLEQVHVYSTPERDPRGRIVTCSYLAIAPNLPEPTADSDAAAASYVNVAGLLDGSVPLAFDHREILERAVELARAKLQYTTIATSFCAPEFTISELREVYETVWGVELDRANFHRKVRESPGFVEPTGNKRFTSGRPAALYRQGRSRSLDRPLLIPSHDEMEI
ncbi:NUDIX hydrolase [Actinophytocola oryzae]|uniref:8-oxo-dGTP diphosphatase n=1 Tax=Actinophytocola oryzae TaxID=502181 RepID=A0A4R7UX86_9PSEU|nr:NUDIX domain-containing protein [Actinophytocola oryzae]TDV40135.1 8-oxo-dGTP diphosphatase [Actinophytocola oryzae]